MTSTSAGNTPENRASGPSSFSSASSVPTVEGALGSGAPGNAPTELARLRVVMRVLITQIGFVRRTVAEPASAPASMDSRVERRGVERALRKAARDHS